MGDGIDTLIDVENIIGSNFADILTGSIFANRLTGGNGNDTLDGNDGVDTLTGGAGADVLIGGLAADIFDFNAIAESTIGIGHDRILDFSSLQGDKIDLSTIDANTLTFGNGIFNFIGNAAFVADTANAGQLRIDTDGFISGDVNGDGISDFEIALTGVTNLNATDFIL